MELRPVIAHLLQRNILFTAFTGGAGVEIWISRPAELEQVPWQVLDRCRDVFIVCPFRTAPTCSVLNPFLKIHSGSEDKDLQRIDEAVPFSPRSQQPPVSWQRTDHENAIGSIQASIAAGATKKVVLSRTLPISIDDHVLLDLFFSAVEEQNGTFVCLLNSAEYGIWLGASPETLVQADKEQVCVDSIAGTMKLESAPDDAAEWGQKERDEQEFVTRGIIDTFKKLGADGIEVQGPFVLRTPYSAHLYSRLGVERKRSSLSKMVQRLHPTPAVCGTPKDMAADLIARLEPHDRSLYAGFWGPWQVEGSTHLWVNIRCMRYIGTQAYLFVGGGITAESETALEWEETEQKAEAWLRPLRALQPRIS